ncbi:MAG: PAS domain S-box protein [Nitrospiraceae bacterium]
MATSDHPDTPPSSGADFRETPQGASVNGDGHDHIRSIGWHEEADPQAADPSSPEVPPNDTRQSRPYRWLLLLVAGLTITAMLTMSIAMRYLQDRLIDTAGENLALASAEIADKVDRMLFERYGDVVMMARTFASQPHDYKYLTEHLVWMKASYHPIYRWLGVADAQGRIVSSTDSASLGQDVSRTDWFTTARDRQQVYLGEVGSTGSDPGVLVLASPIRDLQGQFAGVVTSRIGLDMVESVMTRTMRAMQDEPGFAGDVEYQFLTRDGLAFVDSGRGAAPPINLREEKLPSALLSMSGTPGYVQEQHTRRKVKVVTGYAKSQGNDTFKGYGWTVLLRRDHADILTPIQRVLNKLWLASGAIGIPALGLLFWSARQLRRESVQAQYESQCARAAEAALLQSQQRIKAVVDTSLDAVISMDADGRVTEWNVQAVRLFGWTRHEAIGRSFAEIVIPPRYREMYEQGLHHFLTTGEGPFFNRRVETTACRKDSREFPVELTVSPSLIGHTHIFSVFVRDIIDRRQTEQRLSAQFAVTQVVAEAQMLDDAIPKVLHAIGDHLQWDLGVFWMVDGPLRHLRCFDIWVEEAGFAEEFVAATWRQPFESGVGLPGRVMAGGRPAWVRDVALDPNFPRRDVAYMANLHGAFAFPVKVAGEVVAVVELLSKDVREPDEELMRMAADLGLRLGQFMTRLRAEEALRHTEDQLRQSQKMEAVGRLAGGVAHDFNNLLTVIRGYCELILARLREDEPMRKEIEEVKKAGDRAAGLTNQLLAFSRRQFVSAKVVNLNEIVSGMDGMLRRLIGEDLIELCTNLAPDLATVKADPGQIEQVIMNLAVNAHDAMPMGGKLTIDTKNVSIDKRHPLAPFALEPGEYVSLIVGDTGHGMDEKTQTHIFEPFFTTKEKGKGTGLGLSTVYGIVKQTGGHIEVDSAIGKGARFKIYFPKMTEAAAAAAAEKTPAALRVGGKETVLVVEDEPAVRILVQETLRMHGYNVLMARHGIEALLTGAKHVGPIHLLLTDVVMPQMSGPEVADKLTKARRDMRVLFMSGYPDHPAFGPDEARARAELIQKPFSPHELAQRVRELLDRPSVAATSSSASPSAS